MRLLAALALLLAHDLVDVPHALLLVGLRRPLGAHLGSKLTHLLLVVATDHHCRLLLDLHHPAAVSTSSPSHATPFSYSRELEHTMG